VKRLRGIVVGLAVLTAAGPAAAHQETPEVLVADLASARSREATGIEKVERDAHQPRLLLVRVGDAWRKLPVEVRRKHAEEWAARWRRAVPTGVVAVVDAKTERPVVRFGAQGNVLGVEP
jgi:hypothetical protein